MFIEIQQPTGNPDEKLNLMLVSGDLPDIALIDRREATLNKYIAGGALIPLNDLIDKYAPNIKKRVRRRAFQKRVRGWQELLFEQLVRIGSGSELGNQYAHGYPGRVRLRRTRQGRGLLYAG